MKNKKTKYILSIAGFLTVLFTVMSLSTGCASTPPTPLSFIREEHMVRPDPNNPYQGSWVMKETQNIIYVVKGREATKYQYSFDTLGSLSNPWRATGVYLIDEKTWILRDNNMTLLIDNTLYDRLALNEWEIDWDTFFSK